MVPLNEVRPHHVESFYAGEGGIRVSKLMMLVDKYFGYTMTIRKVPSSTDLILSSAYHKWPGDVNSDSKVSAVLGAKWCNKYTWECSKSP